MAEAINNFLQITGSATWIGYLVAAVIQCFLLLNVVAVGALVFIWLERKIAGRIQDRLGPTRVGGKFGWLQTLADGLKLITKEDITPKDADSMLFKLAPYVSFTASFAAFLVLPFSNGWVAQHVNTGVFVVLAILGLEVFGVILAGYASGSKWSLFGAMREAAQVVSYEVPLGLCVVVPVFICGTMNLVTIANMQAGWFTNWLVFHDPFTFLIFGVFFTCAVASVNRAPFDLAEAESELVAGFHTEYSGLRWSFFFMAEYGSMFLVSGLAAILFFGGWHGPIPVFEMMGWSYGQGEMGFRLTGYLANLAGCANFMGKAFIGVTVMMWVRWTLPRLRIDQVMTTCLKYCVPLAAVGFLGALIWQVNGWITPAWISPVKVREFVEYQEAPGEEVEVAQLPAGLNGRILRDGQKDEYRLKVKEGTNLLIRVSTLSQLDGHLEIRDESGKLLNPDKEGDSQLKLKAVSGDVRLVFRDSNDTGDERFKYRISIWQTDVPKLQGIGAIRESWVLPQRGSRRSSESKQASASALPEQEE